MLTQLYHILAFAISAIVVLVTTPVVRRIGLQSGRFDLPGGRKVHQQPMVRLGGISIFLGTLLALLIVWWTGGFIDASGRHLSPTDEYAIWGVTIGGLAFFLIGLMDDLFGLSAMNRLLMQATVAGIAWYVGVSINFLTVPFYGLVSLPDWVSLPITILWLVGMTNAINWIDGLDGLAAGVSGIAAIIMLVVSLFMQQPAAALIAAALAGGALGFLRYNFNPAKIFMGDGGSYFMGFTLAGVGVIGLIKSVTTVAVILPYLILAVPILDMSAVILDRLRSGNSPFAADKRHLHHRLLNAGLSHRWTVLFIYALTLWAGSLALAFAGIPSGVAYAAGATVLLTYASWRVLRLCR
ncbi:MAG: undecaprenyl/decaprenyl-phosphate alpha-N-acetylglucosaminyl 1-phosphate transferase [Leptolyngbyaceae cyanobacterium T60_A2020_046]|nr:undecaprenyl/decaprenyl-phosphate alpha-N-acetylglucosaminyl 1-phosphate transferase [Leptolyngbyaceae cyanobacterium T60_A2020_046]